MKTLALLLLCGCVADESVPCDASPSDAATPDASPDAAPDAAPPHAYGHFYGWGDSIFFGSTAAYAYERPLYLIALTYPGDVTNDTFPGRTFHEYARTPELRTAKVAEVVGTAAGPPTELWIELSTNDWGGARWAAADFGAAYAAFVDELHAASPGTLVYCQTAIYRSHPTPTNTRGETLEQFRQAVRDACAGRAYATVVEGEPMVLWPDEYYDVAHPTSAGYRHYADGIRTVVGW